MTSPSDSGWGTKQLTRAYSALSEANLARGRVIPRAHTGLSVPQDEGRRITIICNDADYFLRHRRMAADTLADAGHRVRVITGGRPIPAEDRGGWDYVHVPIERWTLSPGADFRLIAKTLREVLGERPDALHLITLKPIVMAGIAAIVGRFLSGRPMQIVATVPGLGRLMSPASTMKGQFAHVSRFMVERAVGLIARRKHVQFTFETASDHATWLEKGVVQRRNSIVISGAGVDPAQFYPRDGARMPGPLRVLFASRLLKSKGLDVFLHAAAALQGRGDIEFLVAGMIDPLDPDGVSVEELESEPAITFLGKRDDMPELLRQVDVVCLPTRYGEGIPRILIEAAATGLASITSDHEGCREIVEDGRTGVIVPEKPVEAAAAAVIAALERYQQDGDLLQRHGSAARRKFLAGDYAEESVVARFVELMVGNSRAA
jgi:glycosyltransferase involved in cell wall biosynthesis